MSASKSGLMIVAVTVRIQGVKFLTVAKERPLFQATNATMMPFSTVWNDLMEIGSVEKSRKLGDETKGHR